MSNNVRVEVTQVDKDIVVLRTMCKEQRHNSGDGIYTDNKEATMLVYDNIDHGNEGTIA
jgi:hypothetical protein